MRIPGFQHTKAEPMPVKLLHCNEAAVYTRSELMDSFKLVAEMPETKTTTTLDLKPPSPKTLEQVKNEARYQAGICKKGQRHSKLLWLSMTCMENGYSLGVAKELMTFFVQELPVFGDPVLPKEGYRVLEWVYNNVQESTVSEIPALESYNITDAQNAKNFALSYADDVLYCPELGWLAWTGKVWEPDAYGRVLELYAEMINSYRESAKKLDTLREAEKAMKHLNKLEMHTRITHTLNLARYRPELTIKLEKLDTDLVLFNCQNGTVNLKTGELQPHNRKDFITRISPVSYMPDALAPKWLEFLNQITDNNKELMKFMQNAFGYTLTGLTGSQCLFFAQGNGANGKSTQIDTIMKLMGSYGRTVPFRDFTSRTQGDSQYRLAQLPGVRMVAASEGGAGESLDESTIKTLTGDSRISARMIFKEPFEYTPKFKVWLASNHEPRIKGDDFGIWRRIRLIPYTQTVPEELRDSQLAVKLEAELSGILTWCVQGAVAYLKTNHLELSEDVSLATKQYQEDQDSTLEFLETYFIRDAESRVLKSQVQKLYTYHTQQQGDYSMSSKALGAALRVKGLKVFKTGGVRFWQGIRLSAEGLTALGMISS